VTLRRIHLPFVTRNPGHTVQRRDADEDVNYDDPQMAADEASDYDTQNTENDEPEVGGVHAVILTQPTSYNVTIGRTLRLECNVEPDSAVVQWYKNNVSYFLGNMKTNPEAVRFSVSSKDLIIKDVEKDDIGEYRCELVAGNPVSITHHVVVWEKPSIQKLSATNGGSVVEGADLLLTCDVSGLPPPQIVWSREIDNGNQRLKETDGEFSANSVFIRNVRKDHAGKYYCYIFNNLGSSQAEINVNVAVKPRVHVHKTIVNSAVNVEAVLQCSAHDEPNPHMRWYKDGRLIEDSSSQYAVSTSGPQSNLTVTPRADQDFGTFTCEAENQHGKHNRSIELVQSPVLEDLEVAGPKLSWTVHSHQPLENIEIQLRDVEKNGDWTRVDVPLPKNKSHKYDIIHELSNIEPGKYEAIVKVKNSNSWRSTEPVNLEIVLEAQPYIHTASVLGGDAHSIRSSTILASIASYLLVRML
ncbi:hypothetical protein O3G_MSEX013158, partial [Manduca sexta]